MAAVCILARTSSVHKRSEKATVGTKEEKATFKEFLPVIGRPETAQELSLSLAVRLTFARLDALADIILCS
jgi:hypothetical protein